MGTEQAITVASEATILAMIQGAQERLIVLAPGLTRSVAACLSRRWQELGPDCVTVILDLDPEVYRLGYGEVEALKVLEQTAAELGTMLQRQPGIRIGLVLADNRTLIYSPTPLLIEAGPSSAQTPNAVLLESPPPRVLAELGRGENGVKEQVIGLDKARRGDIEAVGKDLKQNPPLKFDIARTVRVFNAAFEFVEFELKGCFLSRRTVPIPSDLMGLAKDPRTQRLLTSHFKLVGEEENVSEERVIRLKKWICDRYLITLPKYGTVVLRTNKPDFEVAVKALRRYVTRFQRQIVDKLQKVMDANRKSLVTALTPAVVANPPARWKRFLGNHASKGDLTATLESEIEKAFGSAESLVSKMDVFVLFKGVTYESLSDPDFIKTARKAIPLLKQLHEEYDAARGQDDSDASGLAPAKR